MVWRKKKNNKNGKDDHGQTKFQPLYKSCNVNRIPPHLLLSYRNISVVRMAWAIIIIIITIACIECWQLAHSYSLRVGYVVCKYMLNVWGTTHISAAICGIRVVHKNGNGETAKWDRRKNDRRRGSIKHSDGRPRVTRLYFLIIFSFSFFRSIELCACERLYPSIVRHMNWSQLWIHACIGITAHTYTHTNARTRCECFFPSFLDGVKSIKR